MTTYRELFSKALKNSHGNFSKAHSLVKESSQKIDIGNWEPTFKESQKTSRERLIINQGNINYINSLENKVGFQVVKKGLKGEPWGFSKAHYGSISDTLINEMMEEAVAHSQQNNYTGWDLRLDINTDYENEEFEIIMYYFKEEEWD